MKIKFLDEYNTYQSQRLSSLLFLVRVRGYLGVWGGVLTSPLVDLCRSCPRLSRGVIRFLGTNLFPQGFAHSTSGGTHLVGLGGGGRWFFFFLLLFLHLSFHPILLSMDWMLTAFNRWVRTDANQSINQSMANWLSLNVLDRMQPNSPRLPRPSTRNAPHTRVLNQPTHIIIRRRYSCWPGSPWVGHTAWPSLQLLLNLDLLTLPHE